jgi:hypothetical protein
MAAQPLEGMCFGSSSTIRSADGLKLQGFIAAVEIALDHLLNDRPEKTVLPLETTLILSQKPVEMTNEKIK